MLKVKPINFSPKSLPNGNRSCFNNVGDPCFFIGILVVIEFERLFHVLKMRFFTHLECILKVTKRVLAFSILGTYHVRVSATAVLFLRSPLGVDHIKLPENPTPEQFVLFLRSPLGVDHALGIIFLMFTILTCAIPSIAIRR